MRKRTLRRRLFWLVVGLGVVLLALGGWIVRGLGTAAVLITLTNSRRRTIMRTKTILAAAFAAAFAAALTAIAGGVSLASASTEGAGGKTLTLVSESTELEHYVDNGKPGESVGDIVFFQELLYDRTRGAKPVGHSEIMCFFIGDDGARCSGTFFLPEGKIEAGGAIHFRRVSRIPVLGGTGAYRGARGEVALTTINERRDRNVIRLLP